MRKNKVYQVNLFWICHKNEEGKAQAKKIQILILDTSFDDINLFQQRKSTYW